MAQDDGQNEKDAQDETDAMDDIVSIPLVQELGWNVIPKPQPVERKVEIKKAAIGWSLRPWSPRPTKSMVTMSDIGMGAKARGGTPARRPLRPRPDAVGVDADAETDAGDS